MNSYSIEDAASAIVGAGSDGKPLPGAVKWVELRLRRGEFGGYKAARRWRMTDADIVAAIESLRPDRAQNPAPRPVEPNAPVLLTSMTRTSRRRIADPGHGLPAVSGRRLMAVGSDSAKENCPRSAATGEGRCHPSH